MKSIAPKYAIPSVKFENKSALARITLIFQGRCDLRLCHNQLTFGGRSYKCYSVPNRSIGSVAMKRAEVIVCVYHIVESSG